jgi:hypothetical protein
MHKYVTIDDIYKMIELLPDEKQNPLHENHEFFCAYTNEDGDHCIAGEIIRMLGYDLPDVDDFQNTIPVGQLIDNLYANDFDDEAVEMLYIGQKVADRLTHADDPLAWAFAKRDMVNFFNRSRKEEIAQRNLQAGY